MERVGKQEGLDQLAPQDAYNALIMASIVEREAQPDAARPVRRTEGEGAGDG